MLPGCLKLVPPSGPPLLTPPLRVSRLVKASPLSLSDDEEIRERKLSEHCWDCAWGFSFRPLAAASRTIDDCGFAKRSSPFP